MQTDYFTNEPRPVANTNVPQDAKIIGQASFGSGEVVYTYFFLEYTPPDPRFGGWAFWVVADWVGSKFQPTCVAEMRQAGVWPADA